MRFRVGPRGVPGTPDRGVPFNPAESRMLRSGCDHKKRSGKSRGHFCGTLKGEKLINEFTLRVVRIIKSIPPGKVITYGRTAAAAGNPLGARQVSRILHSMSRKHDLPWHRVINARGKISLPQGGGYEIQKALLEREGISLSDGGVIDLEKDGWNIGSFLDVP